MALAEGLLRQIAPSSATVVSVNESSAAARFSCRWAIDEVPGIRRMLGARWSSQLRATCIGVAPSRAATSERVEDCRREAAKREEGHIGDAAARQFVYQRVVVAMHEIVMVLHADDLGDAVRLFELGRGHVAQAELSDQALTLKLGQGRKLFLDRAPPPGDPSAGRIRPVRRVAWRRSPYGSRCGCPRRKRQPR